MTDFKPKARITDIERVYDGFFKMDLLTIETTGHDGQVQTLKRLNFNRGHAVAMLAYDPVRDEVLLVNELRTGLLVVGDDPFEDSVPAGMIDAGETALDAAKREMLEETGQEMKDIALIHPGAYVSPGGTSEKIALVFGIVDTSKSGGVHGKASEGESIKPVPVAAEDFIQRADRGELKDLKTLTCAFWLACHRQALKDKYAPKNNNDIKPSLS